MREHRNLSEEELALLSAPVEKPTAQWDSYQESGTLRPVREPEMIGGPWAAFHGLEERRSSRVESEGDEDPWYPRWGEIKRQFLPSAGRLYDEVVGYISSQVLFDPYGEGFTEQQRELGSLVSDTAKSLFSFDVSSDFFGGSEIGGLPSTPEQDLASHRLRLQRQFPHTAEFMGGYDDLEVAEELEQREMQRRYPSLTQMSEGLQAITPIHPEHGWQGTHALSRLIEQEPAEFALDLAFSATGIGAGLAGVRGTARGIRAARRGVSPLEDIGDAFGDIDLLTGELSPIGRLRRSTVDIEVRGTRSWDLQNLSQFGRRRREMGTGVLVSPTEIVTASHTLTGKTDAAFPDIERIVATTSGGQRVDIESISGLSPEADIAVLDLPESVDAPLLDISGDISGSDVLYGRSRVGEGYQSGSVGGEIARDPITGAALRETSYVGRRGLSGAGLVTEQGELAGIYLGTVDDAGMFADAPTVQRFLEEDRPTYGVQDFDRSWHRERLMARALHGGEGVESAISPFDFVSTFQGSQLHSRDPELEQTLFEGDWHERFGRGVSRERLPQLSASDPLHEIYGSVSGHRNLFFRLGTRGEDVSGLRNLDVEQTLAYREWYHSERPPAEDFRMMGGGEPIVSTVLDPDPETPLIQSAGVMGIADITALSRHLQRREESGGQLGVQLFGPSGQRTVGVDPTSDVLQVITGRSPVAPFGGRDPSIHLPGHQFVYEPEVLFELDVPEVDELRRIYRDMGETDPAQGLLWLPDPNVSYKHDIPPTLISAESFQRDSINVVDVPDMSYGERTARKWEYGKETPTVSAGGSRRLSLARSVEGRTQVESVLVDRAGRAPSQDRPPLEEWTDQELQRERLVGDQYWARQATEEHFRRRFASVDLLEQQAVTAPSGQAIPVGQSMVASLRREIAREQSLARREFSGTDDTEFEHEIAHRRATEDITDHTQGFDPQGYKEELWEPLEGTRDADADETGLVLKVGLMNMEILIKSVSKISMMIL